MSTRLMGQCWDLAMPPTSKAVLMSLADQANDAGVCWPAVGTICRRTCLSERAVQYAIKALVDSGILTINRAPGRSTNFQINPASADAGTPSMFAAPPRGDDGRGGAPRAPRGAPAAGGGARGAPRTVKNRQGTNLPPPPPGEPRDGFDAFWAAYPAIGDRKAAKPQCLAKWIKLKCAPMTERIVAALEEQKKLPKWAEEGGRFIPSPLVWLNQRRWEATEETALLAPQWFETRGGAERKAKEVGLPKWDESIPFSEYVGKVRKAIRERESAQTNS